MDLVRRTHYKLDDDHNVQPCTFMEWLFWFDSFDRHVALTDVTDRVQVSTVFMGLNLSPHEEGAPKVFETMVFIDGDGKSERRSATWAEAEAVHAEMLAYVNSWAFDYTEQDAGTDEGDSSETDS